MGNKKNQADNESNQNENVKSISTSDTKGQYLKHKDIGGLWHERSSKICQKEVTILERSLHGSRETSRIDDDKKTREQTTTW